MAIQERESLYLDLVRAAAAFVVVLDHAPYNFDVSVPRWGHHAVMVFFVLSGYVISTTTSLRENTPRLYLIARFSRLWSVLVPALAITIACDLIASASNTTSDFNFDYAFVRGFAAIFFLSETWVSIQPFSMGVFWSLCCEFWYYIFFAIVIFMPQRRLKIACAVLALLMGGHKTILLLPVWLMGVSLHRSTKLRKLNDETNIILFILGGIFFTSIMALRIYDPAFDFINTYYNPIILRHLAQARLFWLDWVVGLCVAAHLLGARTAMRRIPIERLSRPIRWCAGISFSAYLLHLPLYHLVAAWLPRSQGPLAIAIVVLTIGVIAPPIERSRFAWRRMLKWVAQRIAVSRFGTRISV